MTTTICGTCGKIDCECSSTQLSRPVDPVYLHKPLFPVAGGGYAIVPLSAANFLWTAYSVASDCIHHRKTYICGKWICTDCRKELTNG